MGAHLAADVTRIAYVVNEAKFFVSHRLVLARAARAAGYDVVVITPDGDGVDAIRAAGLPWYPLHMSRGGRNPVQELRAFWHLVRLYRALRPDLVHHVAMKSIVYGTPAARLAGVPAVLNAVSGMGYMFTGGGLRGALGGALYHAALRHPNMLLLVQNADDRERFAAWFPALPVELVEGSGVDLVRFRPALSSSVPPALSSSAPPAPTSPAPPAPSSSAPPARGRVRVLFTGRMLAHKGVREFIAAAARVRERHPQAEFVLVGRVDEGNPTAIGRAELERACARGDVTWLGERADIDVLLRESTVFCLPSYREGLSKSLIEAAACGLPLVTTDVPGCRDVVRDGESGVLVPAADAEALAGAIAQLLDDPARCRRMGQAARADAEARFGADAIVAAQLALYPRLLAAAGRPA